VLKFIEKEIFTDHAIPKIIPLDYSDIIAPPVLINGRNLAFHQGFIISSVLRFALE
jgi:hypothetical protein